MVESNSVIRLDKAGALSTIFDPWPPLYAYLTGIAFQPDGRILVTDFNSADLFRMNSDGTDVVVLYDDGGWGLEGCFSTAEGDIYVASRARHELVRLDANGSASATIPVSGFQAAAADPDGGYLVVSSDSILRYDARDQLLGVFADPSDGLYWVHDIDFDPSDGTWLVLDATAIHRFAPDGKPLGVVLDSPGPFGTVRALAIEPDGEIVASCYRSDSTTSIEAFSPAGNHLGSVLGPGASWAHDLALDNRLPVGTHRGNVALRAAAYGCPSLAGIRVRDRDLDKNPAVVESVAVQIASDSEPIPEIVLLTEEGPTSPIFSGTIPLSSQDAPGVLRVATGDRITVQYFDLEPGGGVSLLETDQALADCTPPTLSSVTVAAVSMTAARIDLVTTEPTRATIEYGSLCGSDFLSAAPPQVANSHSVVLSGLEPETPYRFRVRLTDLAGNETVDDDGGSCYAFTTSPLSHDLFVADPWAGQIDRLDSRALFVGTLPTGTFDYSNGPTGLAFTPDHRLVVNTQGGDLFVMDDGALSVKPLVTDDCTAMAVDPNGGIFVASWDSFIRKYALDGTLIGSLPIPSGCARSPALAVAPDGSLLVTCRYPSYEIDWFDPAGVFRGVFADLPDDLWALPSLVLDPSDNSWLVVFYNQIEHLSPTGIPLGTFASLSPNPADLLQACWGSRRELLVAGDAGEWGAIFRFRADGTPLSPYRGDSSHVGSPAGVAVPDVPQVAGHRGRARIDGAEVSCSGAARIEVYDADLDTDPTTFESILVEARSPSDPAPESVLLVEGGASGSLFAGELLLSNVETPGRLTVSAGDRIVVTYHDADDGTGLAVDATTSALVECTPPVISGIEVHELLPSAARVTWTTSEPADSRIDFGEECEHSTGRSHLDLFGLEHSLWVRRLPPGKASRFSVASTDAAGNVAVENAGGECLELVTPPLSPDVLVIDWNEPNILRFDPAGNPKPSIPPPPLLGSLTCLATSADFRTLFGFQGPSGYSAGVISLDEGWLDARQECLPSYPPRALARHPNGDLYVVDSYSTLSRFDSSGNLLSSFSSESINGIAIDSDGNVLAAMAYSGEIRRWSAAGEDLGVLLSPSSDLAFASWVLFDPTDETLLVYDGSWGRLVRYSKDGTFLGVLAEASDQLPWMTAACWASNGELLVEGGYPEQISRLDPTGDFVGLFAGGFSSLIGLAVLGSPAEQPSVGRIRLEPRILACAGELRVLLRDSDLDVDPARADTATVTVASDADPVTEPVTLTEVGPHSGRFEGTFPISAVDAPGVLRIFPGGTVTASYQDTSTAFGESATIVDSNHVEGNCPGLFITQTAVFSVGSSAAAITWITDDAADSTVEYGTTPALGLSVHQASSSSRHSLPLVGLPSCRLIYFRVRSADPLGNVAVDDNGGALFTFETSGGPVRFETGFEGGVDGWTSGGSWNDWQLGSPAPGWGPSEPHGGVSLWGTNLTGPYSRGGPGAGKDSWLMSPAIDLTGLDGVTLSFSHWFDVWTVASGDGGELVGDGGWLEIDPGDGGGWRAISLVGRYTGFLDASFPNSPRACFSGQSQGWRDEVVDLNPWAGRTIRIRFRIWATGSGAGQGAGWYVDDLRFEGHAPCNSHPIVRSFSVEDDVVGDGDGLAEPGEEISLRFEIENSGATAATGISGTLTSNATEAIVTRDSAAFGDLSPFGTGSGSPPHVRLWLSPSAVCGAAIPLTLRLDWMEPGTGPKSAAFPIALRVDRKVRPIAILDHAATEDVSYWLDTATNSWSSYRALLDSDPERRFATSILPSLAGDALLPFSALVVPDCGVPNSQLAALDTWFVPGKTLVLIDNAATLGAFAGWLWPAAVGSNGWGYWFQGSSGSQRVVRDDPVTACCPVGTVLPTLPSESAADVSLVPADAVPLLVDAVVPDRFTVFYRDVPGRGRVVFLGPFSQPVVGNEELVRRAVLEPAGTSCPPLFPTVPGEATSLALRQGSDSVLVSAAPGARSRELNLYEGSLAALLSGSYDHAHFADPLLGGGDSCGEPTTPRAMNGSPGDRWYLAVGSNVYGEGSYGDSSVAPRPAAAEPCP